MTHAALLPKARTIRAETVRKLDGRGQLAALLEGGTDRGSIVLGAAVRSKRMAELLDQVTEALELLAASLRDT